MMAWVERRIDQMQSGCRIVLRQAQAGQIEIGTVEFRQPVQPAQPVGFRHGPIRTEKVTACEQFRSKVVPRLRLGYQVTLAVCDLDRSADLSGGFVEPSLPRANHRELDQSSREAVLKAATL